MSTLVVVAVAACAGYGQSPVDRFIVGLEDDPAIPAEATTLIRQAWAKCQDCDGEEFLTQALAVLSPRFREGLDAYDAQRHEDCAAIMGELRAHGDPFIATHAAAYEIKSLVAMERLLDAGQLIKKLGGEKPIGRSDVAAYSYFAPEISFLNGYCLLSALEYDAAAYALSRFLADYPDASQRLVVAAQQMVMELANRRPGRIGEVVDLMDYAGRRLKHADSGTTVQARQQRVIEILDRLIDEAENQEKNSSKSSTGGGGGSGSRAPDSPMQRSQLPGGSPQDGSLRSTRRANPGEMWGAMPPVERERILQALRDSFPSRYRQLVEQYYEQLAKKP